MSREALTAIRADALAAREALDWVLARLDAELAPAAPEIDPQLIADLKRDEGLRLRAYPDPLSGGAPWTIGYGHTGPEVRQGLAWTEAQAEAVLMADIRQHNAELAAALPWVARLDPSRRRVLQNMAFNLGVGVPGGKKGLLGFRNTLGMIERGDYAAAAEAMGKSLWAKQVKGRATRLSNTMRTGR
ncbi:glycoside hydrolase family protein [Phenylobacterium sp.]|uniref:glycoside hydrolase family protein n=1 Tax=Phenylobacterium sp. TaxID=1871053 RepID=UPI0025D6FF4F|nr:glycoside hydrolase family protein [Phenylobacterium sp.]MBX3482557.1 glycoside hydrolase family protein [Phenylobacterium sp.]MCW5758765.1 glycoside hydrolase family protein [Phenylobacterium sp.]